VNQNRRVDVSLSPFVEDFNIQTFLSFVQLDGYNPLSVASSNFQIKKTSIQKIKSMINVPNGQDKAVEALLTSSWRPGSIFQSLEALNVDISVNRDIFINALVAEASQQPAGN
jgi:hypothetical protein